MKPNPEATVFSVASGAMSASSEGSNRVMLNAIAAVSSKIIELHGDFLAAQRGKGPLLRFEAAARVRVRQRGIERATELVRVHVVARFEHRLAERLNVRKAGLIHVGREVRIDFRVGGLLVRELAAGHVGRVIVATRLWAYGVDHAS